MPSCQFIHTFLGTERETIHKEKYFHRGVERSSLRTSRQDAKSPFYGEYLVRISVSQDFYHT